MAADRLVWLARPTRKRPEVRIGRDPPQRLESAVLIAFARLLQSLIVYRLLFLQNLFSGATRALESALITQMAQKVTNKLTHKPNT